MVLTDLQHISKIGFTRTVDGSRVLIPNAVTECEVKSRGKLPTFWFLMDECEVLASSPIWLFA